MTQADRCTALIARRDVARQDLLDFACRRDEARDPDDVEDLDDEVAAARARLARAESALQTVYGGVQ